MAKIRIQVDSDAVEQAVASGDFEPAPPGVYVAELVEVNEGFTKGDDGKPNKDRPYLECIYSIIGVGRESEPPQATYSRIWDYVSFSSAAKWKMAQFGLAMGLKVVKGQINSLIEIEPNKPGTVIGRKVFLSLKKDTDNEGNYRPKVRSVTALDEVLGNDSLFDDGGDAEPDEDDAFDSNEDGEDDTGELLTREVLRSMDLKELADVAKDFDLDPKESIVRNAAKKVNQKATQETLVEAILSAQGGDEEEAEEDPF